ncbi:MAG TPA: hypothetical protein VFS35_10430, partial [Terrimicrobiaceae bacterium]|nr:hypothetical protein [Terrimicrobiaceae bacterium]
MAKQWFPLMIAAALLGLTNVAAWAEETAAERPASRTSEFLSRRQSRGAHLDDRLSAAVDAAKAAWPGVLSGRKQDVESYNTALAQVVAALQGRR